MFRGYKAIIVYYLIAIKYISVSEYHDVCQECKRTLINLSVQSMKLALYDDKVHTLILSTEVTTFYTLTRCYNHKLR